VEDEEQVGFRIELDWNAVDDEDQVALRLQSQLMVALPAPQDCVTVDLKAAEEEEGRVEVEMKVEKKREELRGVLLGKSGSGQQSDGVGVLTRLFRSDGGRHWKTVTLLSLSGCGLLVRTQMFPLLLVFLLIYEVNADSKKERIFDRRMRDGFLFTSC
jgi:hypothetical protein